MRNGGGDTTKYNDPELQSVWLNKPLSIKLSYVIDRSRLSRGLRRGSVAVRLLGLRVRIPPGHGCLSVVSVVSVVRQRSLRGADPSSRGVLPSARVERSVIRTIDLYTLSK